MNIGFIGLGHMGLAMAANLLKAGHRVTVYNRTLAKAEPLLKLGAKVAPRLRDACTGDVVFTMLANDEAVESFAFAADGILANLPRGAVHVSSSTISVGLSRLLGETHARAGQRFVAAPVFGRPDLAAVAKLFVVAGGEGAAVDSVKPLLEAISQRVFVISRDAHAANLVKLSGNFLIASVIESLGEALTLVGKAGVDRRAYLEILTSTLFQGPVYQTYGALIVEEKFEPPGFAAPLGQKDIRLVLAAAENLRVPMPLASLLRDRFLTLMANDGERLDWSAIGTLAARDAALPATP
jgi:3-hydroxyisobutyrate dehydrogenase-like beta-hydroxyacid dehydrogenase